MSKPAKQRLAGVASLPGSSPDRDALLSESGLARTKAGRGSVSRLQVAPGAKWWNSRPFVIVASLLVLSICIVHLQWKGYEIPGQAWVREALDTKAVGPSRLAGAINATKAAIIGDGSTSESGPGPNTKESPTPSPWLGGERQASPAFVPGTSRSGFPLINYTSPVNVTSYEGMLDELSLSTDGLHKAKLRLVEVLDESEDACAQALGMPKVAMMFLTKGDLFHHATWRLWFRSARDLLPRSFVHEVACGPNATATIEHAKSVCTSYKSTQYSTYVSPIRQQHLFNVYIHAPPNVGENRMYSLFKGFLVRDRVDPQWGSHQLVEATRYMMWEAYRDPLNERFVLISESDIPIVHPMVFYNQLMSEELSRINTCKGPRNDFRRWSWRMATEALRPGTWRKSGQWLASTREHIRVILDDVQVFRQFETHCGSVWDNDYRRWRDCFSDEHYIPTLLTTKGLTQDGMDCAVWGICATDWSKGGPHPKSWSMREVSNHLIRSKLRAPTDQCDYNTAFQSTEGTFVKIDEAFDEVCSAPMAEYAPMEQVCKLTARKFPKTTRGAVLNKIMKNCESDLHIIDHEVCNIAKSGRGLLGFGAEDDPEF